MEYLPSYTDGLYLAHHGILGQKWGVRRFQNPDGTLTSAGKARTSTKSKKHKGLSDAQKSAIASLAGVGIAMAVVSATSASSDASEFDHYSKALTGSSMDHTIKQVKNVSDKYSEATKMIRELEYGMPASETSPLRSTIHSNVWQAKSNLSSAQRALTRMESKKHLLKVSKKRRDELEKARMRVSELKNATDKLSSNADYLRKAMDDANSRYRKYYNQQTYNSRNNTGDSRSNSNFTNKKVNTSKTKAKDRVDNIKNSGKKIDYNAAKEAERAAKKRVSDAQKNGNLTADMVNDLQEAIARRKVAQQQMEHGVWIINASDNYLMHHGIKGMHWGVRRFETAAGHLTAEGKKRYAKYRDDRRERKAAKKQARAEKIDKIKKTVTSEKFVKGAAITAGILAAGYGATLLSQGIRDQKDINKARELADSIISSDKQFSKLGESGKSYVRQQLMRENLNRMQINKQRQKAATKQKISDYAKAYANPLKSDARSAVRAKDASGGYSANKVGLVKNKKDQFVKANKSMLYDTGLAKSDPEAYRRKKQQEAEKYQKKAEKQKRAQEQARKKQEQERAERIRKQEEKFKAEEERRHRMTIEQMNAQANLLRAQRGY